eukprot:NODE_11338_length_553_cov_12.602326_g11054_i0.p1 GENE.NODE_11338_length_553_cov_12.602326_g11054_i0~~NODE_11338_length_553_cov_12.602326_g11054_i0.p1  ORF type:complete len:146 (-),score=44.21 NODE_11338_length_553_cov_12.602326_g11054_i0:116-505(-)
MSWSTGLCDGIFNDLPILLYGASCCQCLAVSNSVIANDAKATFNLDTTKLGDKCGVVGCSKADPAWGVNMCIFQCCPIIYVLWRKAVREKVGVQGSMVGDIVVMCYCPGLGAMQEARELKAKGLGYSVK